MKHLKYFASEANAVWDAKDELKRAGVASQRMHVFVKDNHSHHFDGLILKSEKCLEEAKMQQAITFWSLILLLSAGVLTLASVSFIAVAVGMLTMFLIFNITASLRGGAVKAHAKDAEVYFLVVDVDESEFDSVKRVTNHHPNLLPQ